MSSKREDVELWLFLTKPENARKYIQSYDWNLPPELIPDRVFLDSGRVVFLNKMDDRDAVAAAMAILRDIEIPMILKTKSYERWDQ